MAELTVDVHLGATINIEEESHSFIKPDISINGLDVNGDWEAQLQQGLVVGIAGLKVLNDGIVEVVSEAVTMLDNPTVVADQLGDTATRMEKIENINIRVVARVRELIAEVKELAGGAAKAPPAAIASAEPEAEAEAEAEPEAEGEPEAEAEVESPADELGALPFDEPAAAPKKAPAKAKAGAAK